MAKFTTSDIVGLCIEKLTELHGSTVTVKSSQMVGGGCINNAVKITTSVGDFFLKWNSSVPSDLFVKKPQA
jgi:fructosamine-3-kinase